MSESSEIDALHAKAADWQKKLAQGIEDDEVAQAVRLVEELRNARQYAEMGQLAEWVSRRAPDNARIRTLYAQCLIDTGYVTAAIDVLNPLVQRLAQSDPQYAEASGLLGRAYKQVFFDAGDKTTGAAFGALERAVEIYREAFDKSDSNTWHGVNLVALLQRGKRLGHRFAGNPDVKAIARRVVAALEKVPEERRDDWHLPTLAEAYLGVGDWDAVERTIRQYVAARDAKPFLIASTLRQFSQVWDLESVDERGRALVDMLRARLLQQGGELDLQAADVRSLGARAADQGPLEAVLGDSGAKTYTWWQTGLQRATAVAAIRSKVGGRIGTGFLLSAKALRPDAADELVVLTNFHVVNEHGASPGIRPDVAEVVFEAVDANKAYAVASILWSSTPDRHDASILRLAEAVRDIAPMPIARALPLVGPEAKTYVIGHPGGRDLAFSFQDNELLDHEGPPNGKPSIEGVCRVHYKAPTEPGSSGSPVFNDGLWEVIALHHKGGKFGMPRLNGVDGTYGANEGVSIGSISAAARW